MPTHRQDLPFIPRDDWRARAACTKRVNDMLWDDKVEYESEKHRRRRHDEAKEICWTQCPVRQECADDVDWRHDEGIRGGHRLPSLDAQRTREDTEMLRLLRKGWSLDAAARARRAAS